LNPNKIEKNLIYTDEKNCINCNKCIHECPVLEANVALEGEDGKYRVYVDEKKCVLCGACLQTCVHGVRHYKDDLYAFLTGLKRGKVFSVLVAPSFYLNFPNEYKQIFGYLKSLGVKSFYSVGFGADIATWGYLQYIQSNDTVIKITSPCPTIVQHIEVHRPDLIPNLIPVHSPMMCLAIYLKKYLNIEEDLVFLSPCVAKKVEIDSSRGKGLIQYNVTFKKLMTHIGTVDLNKYPPCEDEMEYGMGTMFPKPGGLKENIEYYLGADAAVMQIDGYDCYRHIQHVVDKQASTGESFQVTIDALNCVAGCMSGTGTEAANRIDYFTAYQSTIMRKRKFGTLLDPADRLAQLNETFQHLHLEDFLCTFESKADPEERVISHAEVEITLERVLAKKTEADKSIDCSVCGYKTCREMAKAIILGINYCNACIYYVKNSLEANLRQLNDVRQKLTRITTIIDNMPMGANICDKFNNVLDCNHAAVELFGLKDKNIYRQNFTQFLPKLQPDGTDSMKLAEDLFAKALKRGYARKEMLHQDLDGHEIPCDVTLIRFKWHDEYHVMNFMRDLREQYKNEELMRTMDERLNAMLDASPILCAIFDEHSRGIDVNYAAVPMFGLKDKRDYLDRFFDLCPEHQPCGTPTREKVPKIVGDALRDGKTSLEWMHQTLDGETQIPCQVKLERVRLGDKEVVIAYVQDLREQKEMFKKVEEALIREKDASAAKTKFLSHMSHEIRTPMNAVLGIAEMHLQRDGQSPEVEEAFLRIYTSSNMLLSITNDILDLSRVEAGKMEVVEGIYQTASMIVDVVLLNLIYSDTKKIDFQLYVDENIPARLVGDEIRIKQIMNNLLTNAFKYTTEGIVALTVSVEYGENDDITMLFSVRDTGQGMTTEQVECLFDEFSRFNVERNRATEGSGLGLSIANRLAKLMKGKISVESEPEKGSTFTLHLPQRRQGAEILGKETATRLQNLEGTKKMVKKSDKKYREPMPYGRVLVVDDVESNLHVAKGFLQMYQIDAETVSSGMAAITKVEEGNEYDIIFMDHTMPQMDGVEATEIMRAMGYNQPIVALTANVLSDLKDMYTVKGFSGFITKPIDIEKLEVFLIKFIYDKQPPEVIARARTTRAVIQADRKEMNERLIKAFMRDVEKAMSVLRTIMRNATFDGGDLRIYTVQTHSMKSALHNIGKVELSELAEELENAGRASDFEVIRDKTPGFMTSLRAVVNELKLPEEPEEKPTDKNAVALHGQFQLICQACEAYEIETATEIINTLEKVVAYKSIKTVLNDISDYLLTGDYDEAAKLARQTAEELLRGGG